MKKLTYIQFSPSQLRKIGHTIVYLSNEIKGLTKTKLLKLLYILDELSIKKSGIPFLNLRYKVWKFGPVSEELFIDLSSEIKLMEDFIYQKNKDGINEILPIIQFSDDEFSDYDLELMDFVIERYGKSSANELIAYTHRVNAPWYHFAKEYSVLELLENDSINNTEIEIDMRILIQHDQYKLDIYNEYQETH